MKTENTGESKMKVLLQVPFVSQNSSDILDDWKNRSCGIACIKMVLDYCHKNNLLISPFTKNTFTVSELIEEGIAINSFEQKTGWSHFGLVRILRNHGVISYSQEFRSIHVIVDKIDGITFSEGKNYPEIQIFGIKKIITSISSGKPVIVSVGPNFSNNKDNHLIVLTGFENTNPDNLLDGFLYFHDPDSRDSVEKINFKISISDFLKKWRKMAIFVD
ncbi:MAG TPA: C39 family peptidase [Candidatus Paceibacterota bacterium]|nr:C39 family peptidase [Candidatus Paceibacterota bacterium]HMP19062.1 C39 family peptidase [Candidatus Paceibacterota bacterium]HMP85518.1 C39 family peptidase [Candidatus Paceibacterota bacterium]